MTCVGAECGGGTRSTKKKSTTNPFRIWPGKGHPFPRLLEEYILVGLGGVIVACGGLG